MRSCLRSPARIQVILLSCDSFNSITNKPVCLFETPGDHLHQTVLTELRPLLGNNVLKTLQTSDFWEDKHIQEITRTEWLRCINWLGYSPQQLNEPAISTPCQDNIHLVKYVMQNNRPYKNISQVLYKRLSVIYLFLYSVITYVEDHNFDLKESKQKQRTLENEGKCQ
uniref:Uncharacterized protein n=1 Tax=Vombatus ursinus TaxID=29139 RepID=A0A4X2KAT4_VOMUR